MDKKFYSAKEARETLGMTHSALLNQVTAGNLQRIIPPGKRQGVYLKEEVDKLKGEMEAWLASRYIANATPAKFVKATIADIPEAVDLANAVFGGVLTIPVEKRIAWLERNPDIDYFIKQEGQIVGYLSLVPLKEETIEELLRGERYAKDLKAEEIVPYSPNIPVDIYGMAIGVKPAVSLNQKREWGATLITGARSVIISLGTKGITIKHIRAHSSTPDGIRLMRHIGFTETVASIPGMRDFEIDIKSSGIPFIMEYKRELMQWNEEQKDRTIKNTAKKTSKQTRV